MTDEELDEALKGIHKVYGNDLAAFFRDAKNAVVKQAQTSNERMAELEAQYAEAKAWLAEMRKKRQPLEARIAELEAALTDALYASDIIDGFVCGCGFVEPKDYSNYKEAHARIEDARLALPKTEPNSPLFP